MYGQSEINISNIIAAWQACLCYWLFIFYNVADQLHRYLFELQEEAPNAN